ncbi:MAG: DUF937 domain-containing protein [Ancalomicrobiaceae bacterium]|nr:DUF937 domain-containing protein [Ancalomicrobiaceae bacterium]
MIDMTAFLGSPAGSDAIARLARQFALPPEAVKRAFDVAMPTLAATAQRQMSDPQALTNWIALMTPVPTRPASGAASADPARAGAEAIGQLFGSSEVADAVAGQVAATTGLGQAVTTAMMPWAAVALAASLAAAANPGGDPHDLAKAIAPVTSKLSNPIGPNTPFDNTFGEFVRGYNRGRPPPQPEPPASELEQLLGTMVEAGRQAHATHIQAVEEILDRLMGRARTN